MNFLLAEYIFESIYYKYTKKQIDTNSNNFFTNFIGKIVAIINLNILKKYKETLCEH